MPMWFQALAWGTFAGAALLLGAGAAWRFDVPRKAVSSVLAFGAGVLISALAFELVDEANTVGGLWPTVAGFLLGAVAYVGANTLLVRWGAEHRRRGRLLPIGIQLGRSQHARPLRARFLHVRPGYGDLQAGRGAAREVGPAQEVGPVQEVGPAQEATAAQDPAAAPEGTAARAAGTAPAPTEAAPASAPPPARPSPAAKTPVTAESGGVAIAVGALLDGIPESVVLGLGLVGGAAVNPTMLAAIFISNVPEGLASTADMKRAGKPRWLVFAVWGSIALLSGFASLLGYAALQNAPGELVAAVTAVAAGGILAMLADTMIPEAFEEQHMLTGLIAALGFLAAFILHQSA